MTSDDEYGLRFRLYRGLGDALAASDEMVPARDAYLAALSAPVHPEEQVPELLFSLSELYRKLGDAGGTLCGTPQGVEPASGATARPSEYRRACHPQFSISTK